MTVQEFKTMFPKASNGTAPCLAKKTGRLANIATLHTIAAATPGMIEVSAVTLVMGAKSKTILLKSFLKDYKPVPQPVITPGSTAANPGDLTVQAWNHIADRLLTGLASRKLVDHEVIGKSVAEAVADKIATKLARVMFTKNFVTTLAMEMRRQNETPEFAFPAMPEGQFEHPEVAENFK